MCSSAKYVLSFTCVMITLRSSAPRPRITCLSKSCVSGRENLTPASSIAMALASAGPIQIGSPRWPSGPHIPGGEILPLCRSESVDRHAHRLQLQTRDLLIELDRNPVHVLRQFLSVVDDVLGGERLIGE